MHRFAFMFPLCMVLAVAQHSFADDFVPVNRDPSRFSAIEPIVRRGIADGEMPGAVVVVADRLHVLYAQAFGVRQVEPKREPMTLDTVFDLASLTKPIATATSVMKLVERNEIELNAPVAHYLPEFGRNGKSEITVSDLLLHVGGLTPDNSLRDYRDGTEKSWKRICDLKPIASRGEKFAYSDVGFIVLGKLVEVISGQTLDQFAIANIFRPLNMNETMFNPNESLRQRAAPTESRDGQPIRGDVHDPRAFLLGGVAGHAGLFSTAKDLVVFGQMLLGKGTRDGVTVLATETVDVMATPRAVPRGTRTFGWDHRSPYSKNRGNHFSNAAIGHGGFTGTVIWIDPVHDRVFVFLSNRLHPDGKGTVNGLAGEIATSLIGESKP